MRTLFAAVLLGVSIFTSSAQEVRRALPVQAQAPTESVNELALFLSGRPSNSLAALQQQPGYQSFSKGMARLWTRYHDNYFVKISEWSGSQLAALAPRGVPVYYFFGGPDAISPIAFFPDSPVYILGGLEPVGSIAPPTSLPPEVIADGLANLEKSTEVILSFGHFITKDMKVELERSSFRGVFPILISFLSLSGADILSADYVGVTSDGGLHDYGTNYTGGGGQMPGLKIVFQRPGRAPQTLYYVQANVADDSIKSGLLSWAGSFGQGIVYLKAASYLMHETYFSRIRSFLMKQGEVVVQDDSGIPYKFFVQEGWRCWLFGTYTGTLDIFKKYYQPDLQAAYGQPGVTPLPFGFGYKWRPGESTLMVAVKPRKAGSP